MSYVCMSSFGGSGENGRNCHCITVDDQIILLDCGVKREIIDGTVGFYPNLNEEVVKKISCVFLSHCHEDHVASLPLVYHYGYTGKVYATKETIAETVGFIKKWMTFVEKKNGENANKLQILFRYLIVISLYVLASVYLFGLPLIISATFACSSSAFVAHINRWLDKVIPID